MTEMMNEIQEGREGGREREEKERERGRKRERGEEREGESKRDDGRMEEFYIAIEMNE